MKQPDRFHRMAEALHLEHIPSPWSRQIPLEAWDGIEYRIARLLRRQHAAIVRMVNNRVPKKAWSPDVRLGYGQAVMDILDRLARRRR